MSVVHKVDHILAKKLIMKLPKETRIKLGFYGRGNNEPAHMGDNISIPLEDGIFLKRFKTTTGKKFYQIMAINKQRLLEFAKQNNIEVNTQPTVPPDEISELCKAILTKNRIYSVASANGFLRALALEVLRLREAVEAQKA